MLAIDAVRFLPRFTFDAGDRRITLALQGVSFRPPGRVHFAALLGELLTESFMLLTLRFNHAREITLQFLLLRIDPRAELLCIHLLRLDAAADGLVQLPELVDEWRRCGVGCLIAFVQGKFAPRDCIVSSNSASRGLRNGTSRMCVPNRSLGTRLWIYRSLSLSSR